MGLTHSLMIEDQKAKEAGFRNFTSFVFVCYFDQKKSLRKCAEIIGISFSSIRLAMEERGWKRRTLSQAPKGTMRNRTLDFERIIAEKVPNKFPWCALYYLYYVNLLDTYEIASFLKISQFSVIKLMRRYKIERRNPGTRKFFT